jgi:hypothetical protein
MIKVASKYLLQGGKAQEAGKTYKDFDLKTVAQGMKVESEHTNNKALQKEIVADHLTEDKKYYTKLKKMEKKSNFDSKYNIGKEKMIGKLATFVDELKKTSTFGSLASKVINQFTRTALKSPKLTGAIAGGAVGGIGGATVAGKDNRAGGFMTGAMAGATGGFFGGKALGKYMTPSIAKETASMMGSGQKLLNVGKDISSFGGKITVEPPVVKPMGSGQKLLSSGPASSAKTTLESSSAVGAIAGKGTSTMTMEEKGKAFGDKIRARSAPAMEDISEFKVTSPQPAASLNNLRQGAGIPFMEPGENIVSKINKSKLRTGSRNKNDVLSMPWSGSLIKTMSLKSFKKSISEF